jgi:hypothetical protein
VGFWVLGIESSRKSDIASSAAARHQFQHTQLRLQYCPISNKYRLDYFRPPYISAGSHLAELVTAPTALCCLLRTPSHPFLPHFNTGKKYYKSSRQFKQRPHRPMRTSHHSERDSCWPVQRRSAAAAATRPRPEVSAVCRDCESVPVWPSPA